jgi:ribonuclease D
VNETGYPGGPTRPEGRLLALRCLGLPLVATRTPMSRRRALRYRLAACCARLRPGTTAELASLVLRMSDEIDTRERMLDAALGSAGRGPDEVRVRRAGSMADRPRRAEAVNRLAS